MKKSQGFIIALVITLLGGVFLIGDTGIQRASAQTPINPADFSGKVDNPLFTLVPGTTFSYKKNNGDGSVETVKMVVTNKTRVVSGVKTLVIWDRAWLDGSLIEETYDWYAQDKDGNVWYFGEDTKTYEGGKVKSTKGTWESGVDGAEAGIIMEAKPQVGDSYRQEYYKGVAEDTAQVLALDQTVSTPYGSFNGCLQTLDASTLDLTLKEHKYYCPKAGGNVSLVVDTNTNEREELVNIQTDAAYTGPEQAIPSTVSVATPGMPTTGKETAPTWDLTLLLAGFGLLAVGWLVRRRRGNVSQ